MAISGLGFHCRPNHLFYASYPLFRCIRHTRSCSIPSVGTLDEANFTIDETPWSRSGGAGEGSALGWKKLNSEDLGIRTSMIARPTRMVLNGLKKKGYDVYLVGGCVRDLILKRIPKDFDIITSADLMEIQRAFSRCNIVGKRFPICHVHIEDTFVEVSSFSTNKQIFHGDLEFDVERPHGCNAKDYVRWKNCLQRDFTIDGLMFDPYAKLVYDYIGGLEDIRKAKVRTVISASTSFQEDCARILRAVRIAARLGFRFSKETAVYAKNLARSISRLDKGRLMMEMDYMLAYGSGEASLRLLWKFGLLEILLPIQAAYFAGQGFRRCDKRTNMLLSLFSNLDKLLAPDRPCDSSLWVGILAFHKALLDKQRDPLVVAVFCLAVHNGGDISEATKIAKRITKPHDDSFNELSEPLGLKSRALIDEVLDLAASVKQVLCRMTDEYYVSQAMAKYPRAPYSDLVFIPLALFLKVCRVFDCVKGGAEKGFVPKKGGKIDYKLLTSGNLQEVRHTFARVVFDTVYPL